MTLSNRRIQRGVSAVEAMIVVSITTILVGAGAPSLDTLRQRHELIGLAGQIETDLQFARSEAVSRNRALRLTFGRNDGASCYLVHEGPSPACTCGEIARDACSVDGAIVRTLVLPAPSRVHLSANVSRMAFDPLLGTVTPTATLRAESRDGAAVHQIVSLVGRVRACSPGGRVSGMPAC
jgi:type IV fimbrial biogenesis protein FimT